MSILRRDVLYTKKRRGKGDLSLVNFIGWAMTTTTLGTMVEPFQVNTRELPTTSFVDFDLSDPMTRVDNLVNIGVGKENTVLSHGEDNPPIHGGDVQTRVFRKTGNFDSAGR